jgi:hypothetical protein
MSTGNFCVFVGAYAGTANTTGTKNIGIGYGAGDAITTGSNNTIIGDYAGSTTLADTVAIYAGTTERLKVTSSGLFVNGSSTALSSGKVLQVIQSVSNTATYPTNSWTDVTGSSISITPSSSSSKILFIFNTGGLCGGDTRGLLMQLLRGSTKIRRLDRYGYSTVTLGAVPIFLTYLDSPNTTSAVTYKIQAAEQNTSGAWEINDAADTAGAVVIAMEIAG